MTGHTNLFRRGATYYFRARVPLDIIETYGQSEEKFSLKTKDRGEAITRVREAAHNVECKFKAHRNDLERSKRPALTTITTEQLTHIHDVYYHYLLDEHDDVRLDGLVDGQGQTRMIEGMSDLAAVNSELQKGNFPSRRYDEHCEDVVLLQEAIRNDHKRGRIGDFYKDETAEVLSWDSVGIKIDENSIAFKQVGLKLQEAAIRAYESIEKRNEGRLVDTPAIPQVVASESLMDSNVPLLSEVMEEWIKDKSRTDWKAKTIIAHRVGVGVFIDMCGDRPFNNYAKADARAFKDALLGLPKNWKRRKEFKGMNIQQAAEKAVSLGIPPMSPNNAKKLLQFVSSLWRWLLGNYDELDRNIFDGIVIRVSDSKRRKRSPFTLDELNTIFNSPIYTGCASKSRWRISGDCCMKDTAKYWAPFISLYSGARVGEILQLDVSDIKEEGGIHYFDINKDDGKNLKTDSSERIAPIHQTLIDAGFLALVAARKAKVYPVSTSWT